ncbi:MAG TPA: extracellular solute-binding protein [Thermotogaceae bacterium]|nr:extracellular solute-binding protein [Thermotogaceae bacterium]
MKKFAIILLLVLAGSLFLIAGIANILKEKNARYPNYCGEKTVINVYSWLPEPIKLLNIFEKRFSNIQINWIKLEKEGYRDYIIKKLKAEDCSIDVFQVDLWDLSILVNSGLVLNLSNQNIDPYVTGMFDGEVLKTVSRMEPIYAVTGNPCYSCSKIVIGKKDMIYGIPFEISSFSILYKKKIREKGKEFKNWKEFLDFLDDAKKNDIKIALLDYSKIVSKLLRYFGIIPKPRESSALNGDLSVSNLVETLFPFLKYIEPLSEPGAECYEIIMADHDALSILKNDFNNKEKKWVLEFVPFPEKGRLISGSAFCVRSRSNNIMASLLFSLWLCTDNRSVRYFKNLGISLASKYKLALDENLNMLLLENNFTENRKYFEHLEKYISNLVKECNNPEDIVQLINEKYAFVKCEKEEP